MGSLRKEHGGLASRLEDKGSELAAVKQSLAAQQDALAQAQVGGVGWRRLVCVRGVHVWVP